MFTFSGVPEPPIFNSGLQEEWTGFFSLGKHCVCSSFPGIYCMSKNSWPTLYSMLPYNMGQDLLDIKYNRVTDPDPGVVLILSWKEKSSCEFRSK